MLLRQFVPFFSIQIAPELFFDAAGTRSWTPSLLDAGHGSARKSRILQGGHPVPRHRRRGGAAVPSAARSARCSASSGRARCSDPTGSGGSPSDFPWLRWFTIANREEMAHLAEFGVVFLLVHDRPRAVLGAPADLAAPRLRPRRRCRSSPARRRSPASRSSSGSSRRAAAMHRRGARALLDRDRRADPRRARSGSTRRPAARPSRCCCSRTSRWRRSCSRSPCSAAAEDGAVGTAFAARARAGRRWRSSSSWRSGGLLLRPLFQLVAATQQHRAVHGGWPARRARRPASSRPRAASRWRSAPSSPACCSPRPSTGAPSRPRSSRSRACCSGLFFVSVGMTARRDAARSQPGPILGRRARADRGQGRDRLRRSACSSACAARSPPETALLLGAGRRVRLRASSAAPWLAGVVPQPVGQTALRHRPRSRCSPSRFLARAGRSMRHASRARGRMEDGGAAARARDRAASSSPASAASGSSSARC